MRSLYARLRTVGLPTPYVRKFLLPDWWDDAAAESPAGFAEAVLTIARHLGVDARQLRDDEFDLELPRRHRVQFKLAQGIDEPSVELARLLGEQVAKFALLGSTPPSKKGWLSDARSIRSQVLEAGAPWVGFDALLDYCWNSGIPVLHVSEFPKGSTRKMDALAVNVDGRPAIVLASGRSQPAWLLFILAHELGHIVRGHVDGGGTLVDGDVDERSQDPLEREANEFAIELLTGSVGTRFLREGRWLNAHELADAARDLGERIAVDPGHIILNYAHSMTGNFWPVANAALKRLPTDGDPVSMVLDRISARLDWSAVPPGAAEFVARITGLDAAPSR